MVLLVSDMNWNGGGKRTHAPGTMNIVGLGIAITKALQVSQIETKEIYGSFLRENVHDICFCASVYVFSSKDRIRCVSSLGIIVPDPCIGGITSQHVTIADFIFKTSVS